MRRMGTPVTPGYIHKHSVETNTVRTHADMVTPTRLMKRELICESDGATFVKSNSQLQKPGLGDNSLPVRHCVQYMRVHACVCECECTCARACGCVPRHLNTAKNEYQVPILIYLPYISIP